MISFASDYTTGAHPAILQKFAETNFENTQSYGHDVYSESAAEKIKKTFKCPDAQVFFLTGGTQTNQTVVSTMLKPYEGVIAARTGHINFHEAGSIEYTGHKVLEIPGHCGKIDAREAEEYLKMFYNNENHSHMVFPGMIYISFPTEYGTIYTKKELTDIYGVCRKYNIPLFIDGARLGYGLCASENDVKPEELAQLCDVFYVGGTKVGALCGEAIVFTHNNAPDHFMTQVKQHGALLAKGRLLGIQFDVLFTDSLYFEISGHAIKMAEKLKTIFADNGLDFFINSPTNQQFVIMDNKMAEALAKNVEFECWEPFDESRSVVRFVTGWSTTEESLEYLDSALKKVRGL